MGKRKVWTDTKGAAAPVFALILVVLVAVVFGTVNIVLGLVQRSKAQDAIDSAALWAVTLTANANYTDAQIINATKGFLGKIAGKDPAIAASQVAIGRAAREVTVTYSSNALGTTASPLWSGIFKVSAKARARLVADLWPVCILITEPTDNHTLRASNGSKTDLTNCLVQVNTKHWDAVEAKGSSYIHINKGQNCYVGDIHFGDVKPAKLPTCDLFPDPFISLSVNAPGSCSFTNFKVDPKIPGSRTLSPGVYCGGITVETNATFKPGVYYVKDGPLEISGSKTSVTADGVTFLLSGKDAGIEITSGGTLNLSPADKAESGKFDGFVFFLDQGTGTAPLGASEITKTQVKMSGIIYLKGQHFIIGEGAKVNVTAGSIIAGYLLPQGGDLNFTGKLASAPAAVEAMKKAIEGGSPALVE